MKKIKKCPAIALVLCIVFLSGCSGIFTNPNNKQTLYEIEEMADRTFISVDMNGEYLLFISYKNIENYKLTVYNFKKNKITAETSLDGSFDHTTKAKFNSENEILVYSEENQKGITYDLKLNKLNEVDYKLSEEPVSEIIDESFSKEENYAISYLNDQKICIFDDEPDITYVALNTYSANIYEKDKTFLAAENDDKDNINIYLDNYKSGIREYKSFIENRPNTMMNIELGCFNDDCACVIISITNNTTGGTAQKAYIWNYKNSKTDEKIDIVSGKITDFEQKNKEFTEKLKDKYGINIYCNNILGEDYGYKIELGVNPVKSYLFLIDFEKCLEIFPDHFIREMYEGEELSNKLNICLVKNIEDANAFALNGMDEYRITYAVDNSDKLVIYHELMHIIDCRISVYYEHQDKDFYDLWINYNNGIEEYDENYYISTYASTSCTEDMAETFQYLIFYAETYDKGEKIEELQHEAVRKKAEFLCKSIREAFPSAKDADELIWEKHVHI